MKTKLVVSVLTLMSGFLFSIYVPALSEADVPDNMNQEGILNSYGRLPLYFIENTGQLDPKVRFHVKTAGETLYFTDEGIVFDFFRHKKTGEKANRKEIGKPGTDLQARGETERLVFTLGFDSPRGKIVPEGLDRQSAAINSFVGNDKSIWRTGIPTYKGVLYKGVYKGIDLKVYGSGSKLEYEFIVHPGGNPKDILLTYHGVEAITTNGNGELLIATAFGQLRETKPYIYQEIDGKRLVAGHFAIKPTAGQPQPNKYSYGFQVASYDTSHPLIIDPALVYSTYLGGGDQGDYSSGGADWGLSIAIDPSGNAYVTGVTYSVDFPLQYPYQDDSSGDANAFITKLNASGSDLVYSTYLGGTAEDWGRGIAVDGSGNAYVTGYTTSTDFPTLNPYQAANADGSNAFVTKLNASGSVLYSTYLGGSGGERGYAIAVDESGNAYVTGWTASADFPSTEGSFQEDNAHLPGYSSSIDVFVTKLNASGSALSYSTYLGGVDKEGGYGIAVDASGNAYVTGETFSDDFPTHNPYQGTLGGLFDVFVTKLSSAGDTLAYSTYLGGSNNDYGYGIAVDGLGNAYLTGRTNSDNFPTHNPYQGTHGGGIIDAFITSFDVSGSTLTYSTYLGGGDYDAGYSIDVDASGNAYVTGSTRSTDFPTHNPYQAANAGMLEDAFITKLSPLGNALTYSTYLGGSYGDQGNGIAVDASGNVFVTGYTYSTDFPTQNPYQAAHAGGQDVFVAKLSDGTPPAPTYPYPLYFPHIASIGVWGTEICVINRSDTQTVSGVFKAYSDAGVLVSEIGSVTLSPHGRREITVGDEFTSPANIGYIIFESDSEAVIGYTKFYVVGQYRVAVPSVPDTEINTGDIYISHIASGGATYPWYTGLSLLNTTSSPKTLTIEFDNGTTRTVTLLANEHRAFTIRSLFGGAAQPGIQSGVIKDATGVIGLELFTNNDLNWMSGILLKDDTTQNIYYPHTASSGGWSTGIVAYNPSDNPCDITITPYNAAGGDLTPTNDTIGGKSKYIGTVSLLGLPEDTAWLEIGATSPITGFELFTRTDQLGGYTGVGISGTEGVFAKLESDGATGIAFVNIENSSATVTLTAYADIGTEIATKDINLAAHEKELDIAENIFTGDISTATYIAYSSDKEVVGFQLNVSSDGMMLDGLPGM